MFSAMSGAAAFNILAALAPTWPILLIARALEDLILGGVPAVAMAYLAEEIHPDGLGFTMGLYVGGTAFGRHVRPGGRWMLAQCRGAEHSPHSALSNWSQPSDSYSCCRLPGTSYGARAWMPAITLARGAGTFVTAA